MVDTRSGSRGQRTEDRKTTVWLLSSVLCPLSSGFHMPLPIVAIVGRPNVGKSSLFNYLAARRISIVDPTAGVTRDRVTTLIEADGRYFELVDTGGIGIEDVDNLTKEIERQ